MKNFYLLLLLGGTITTLLIGGIFFSARAAEVGDYGFCSPENPCGPGQGDCDTNKDCQSGLYCLFDVGRRYGFSPLVDVCDEVPFLPEPKQCPEHALGHSRYCSDECPCPHGAGDCDSDRDCEPGLKCFEDLGPRFGGEKYGYDRTTDICVDPSNPYPKVPEPVCDNDGQCESGETPENCPADCPSPPTITSQDLDGDGLYEDFNGDGVFEISDCLSLAWHRNSPKVQANWQLYDFNGNGRLDFGDSLSCAQRLLSPQLRIIKGQCTDSDGGISYYVKGACVYQHGNLEVRKDDKCQGSVLIEYYCDNNKCKEKRYECKYGCKDGACLKIACTKDSDCGSVTYGDWSPCSYPSTCAETGTKTREKYIPKCKNPGTFASSCEIETKTETGTCTRDTDGRPCNTDKVCSDGACKRKAPSPGISRRKAPSPRIKEPKNCTRRDPCGRGEGDCGSDRDCKEGLECVRNVGEQYGYKSWVDVCLRIKEPKNCTRRDPCGQGEGDCGSDRDCKEGLECVENVGEQYGYKSWVDVCLKPEKPKKSVCGNGKCERGENSYNCPQDCRPRLTRPVCGNGRCETGETPQNCPQDCKPAPGLKADFSCDQWEITPGSTTKCQSTSTGARLYKWRVLSPPGQIIGRDSRSSVTIKGRRVGNIQLRLTVWDRQRRSDSITKTIQVVTITALRPVCGNGRCETGETPQNCPQDCRAAPTQRPTVSIKSSKSEVDVNKPFRITVSATTQDARGLDYINICWPNKECPKHYCRGARTCSNTWTRSEGLAGTYTYTGHALGKNGLIASNDGVQTTVRVRGPVQQIQVSLGLSQPSPTRRRVVASLSEGPDNIIQGCWLKWEAGKEISVTPKRGTHQVSYTYKSDGRKTVTYKCRSKAGQEVATTKRIRVEVEASPPPSAGKYDMLFVALGVPQGKMGKFRSVANDIYKTFISDSPLTSAKANKLTYECNRSCQGDNCVDVARYCAQQSPYRGKYDHIIGLCSGCGSRRVGMGWGTTGRREMALDFTMSPTYNINAALHEMGHNFGFGHVYGCGACSPRVYRYCCRGHNKADCELPRADQKTFYMSYCKGTRYGPAAYRHLEKLFSKF